jgi:hypothetical protein
VLHGTKGSKKKSWRRAGRTKVGRKPNLENWGTEPTEKGFAYRIKQGIRQNISTSNYFDFLTNVSCHCSSEAPVTAEVQVMEVITAAIQSSAEKKVIDL